MAKARKKTHKRRAPCVGNESVGYRKLLGDLPTQSEHELKIVEVDNLWGKTKSCLQHPQVIVRIATWLGIFILIEGILGILLHVLSLCT